MKVRFFREAIRRHFLIVVHQWGGLPTPDEREAISEIISFVIGRRLMRVGTTIFTKAGRVMEEESVCHSSGDTVPRIVRVRNGRCLPAAAQAVG